MIFVKKEIDTFFEMANVRPDETGLPMVIWIYPKTDREQHGPRIKVSKHYGDKVSKDLFTITISDTPRKIGDSGEIKNKDVNTLINFVKINKDILLDLWYDKISSTKAVLGLKKV